MSLISHIRLEVPPLYFLVAAVIAYYVHFYIRYYQTRAERLPGPPPLPLIGHLHYLFGNLSDNKVKLNERYGDACEISMLGYRCAILSDPEHLRELFSPNVQSPFLRRLPESSGFRAMGMDSEGLLLNNDLLKWRQNRKYFQRSLSPPSFIQQSVQHAVDTCDEMMKYWSELEKGNSIVRLDKWYRAFASDMMGLVASGQKEESLRTLFDRTQGVAELDEAMLSPGEHYRRLRSEYPDSVSFFIFVPPFLWNLPIIRNWAKRYHDVLARLTEFEINFINKRKETIKSEREYNKNVSSKNHSSVRSDFLTTLLGEIDDEESAADIIKQNIREMFAGGTGTTTSALCAIAHCLGQNPKYEERMVQELFDVLGKDRPIEPSDLQRLPFTECVINEALRLHPAVPLVYRYSPDTGTEIAGRRFPPNCMYGINIARMHRDPAYFPDPDTFNPDRFTGNWKEKIPSYAFAPFGHGMRACPGRNFVMAEMKVTLAQVYRQYTIKLVKPDEPIRWHFALANDVKELEVRLEKRVC